MPCHVKRHTRRTKKGVKMVRAHKRRARDPRMRKKLRLTPEERKIYNQADLQVLEMELRDKDAVPLLVFGSAPSRYTTNQGRFRKMTNPDKPGSNKESRFSGCVRAMRSGQYGKKYNKEASIKICAGIARRKKRG